MAEAIPVLVADDDEANRANLTAMLEALGYAVEAVASGEAALERLASPRPCEAVILDVLMPGAGGLETLRRYRASGGRAAVIMVSALDEVDTVVQAMRLGAVDYITKPFDGDELREILERVVGDAHPRIIPTTRAKNGGGTHLGDSPSMRRVSELVDRIADADVPVLITGESGVGKDVVAREIHGKSARAARVFVKINCAALPGELLESELFGHERGSFTGAARTKPGQFELADGGTIFLDEIGEMPVSLQAKLLQALQDGEFYRVGGQRKIRVDARVIVATNRDLARAMEEGSFREDLYYRLNVVQVRIPPLRERREDIPALLDHFVGKYSKRYGRAPEQIPDVVVSRFLEYEWPGNIRELENLVRRLMVLQDPRYVLSELQDRLPSAIEARRGRPGQPALVPEPPPQPEPEETDLRIDLKEVGRKAAHVAEREAIVTMLGHTGGNKREAAERLGISYKAILYKIREFGIGRPRPPRRPVEPRLPAPAPPVAAADEKPEPPSIPPQIPAVG
jgi:two-component system response regulator AtoC